MPSTLDLHSGHDDAPMTTNRWLFSQPRGEKGWGTLKDWGEQGCCYISVPLLALSIAPTTFSKAFWVTKEAGLGGQGGGSWANTMALSHSPISFTVIKMNRDLSYWAQVHMRHELVTWWGWTNRRGEKVRWAQSWHSTPPLVIHRATSAQHCSYKASLNGTSVPPSTTTVMHFKPNSTTWTLQSGATAAPPLTSPQVWGGRSQRAAHIE